MNCCYLFFCLFATEITFFILCCARYCDKLMMTKVSWHRHGQNMPIFVTKKQSPISEAYYMNFTLHYETFSILLVAFLLGAIIGYERQYRQRTAGLRTNTLVATSAAIFVHLAMSIDTPSGAVRVISYVVSGVGFLGAGTIMKEGLNIRGLNTAATLWGSAAVGACAGAGMIADACMATFFVVASNTLLRPMVNIINRQPLTDERGDATYEICVIALENDQREALTLVKQTLKAENCFMSHLDVEPFGDDDVEITVALIPASVSADDLDNLVNVLLDESLVKQAYYSRIGGSSS